MVRRWRKAVAVNRGTSWHWVDGAASRCGRAPRGGWVEVEMVGGVSLAPALVGGKRAHGAPLAEVSGCGTCVMLAALPQRGV